MIDKSKCTACGSCIAVCPVNAISFQADGKAQIDPNICIECGVCVSICPVSCISIDDIQANRK